MNKSYYLLALTLGLANLVVAFFSSMFGFFKNANFTYPSFIFLLLIYVIMGGIIGFLSKSSWKENISLSLLLGIPIMLYLFLFNIGDVTSNEQIPRIIALLEPIISGYIGLSIGTFILKDKK